MSFFMVILPRRIIYSNHLVLLLRGSLVWYANYVVPYNSLKQSPRAWFSRFSSVVQEFGMIRGAADHSVFYHHSSTRQYVYLIVYVDDIIITPGWYLDSNNTSSATVRQKTWGNSSIF